MLDEIFVEQMLLIRNHLCDSLEESSSVSDDHMYTYFIYMVTDTFLKSIMASKMLLENFLNCSAWISWRYVIIEALALVCSFLTFGYRQVKVLCYNISSLSANVNL